MKIIITREEAHMLEDFAALLPGKVAEDMAKDIKPIKTNNGYEVNVSPEYIEATSDFASSVMYGFGSIMAAAKTFANRCDKIAATLAWEKATEEKHNQESGDAVAA